MPTLKFNQITATILKRGAFWSSSRVWLNKSRVVQSLRNALTIALTTSAKRPITAANKTKVSASANAE